MTNNVIAPGGTICILGAGQLGKMTLQAAHQMGYHTMVWAPEGDIPAMEMATHRLVCPYDCPTTLDEVVRNADVITTEWENIPLWLIKKLEKRGALVRPSSKVLGTAQSRYLEKKMVGELNILTTEHAFIPYGSDIDLNGPSWSDILPGILKTDRDGYDGKGQWVVNDVSELMSTAEEAWDEKQVDLILEKRVDIQTELSVLVARTHDDHVAVSDVVGNTHKNGILDTTVWPAIDKQVEDAIQRLARLVANRLELEGILCLEFFVDRGGNILFNEMAPRPHNSFHASIEAADISQFEQHVRAICGLPLGNVEFHSPFEMKNLIGGNWHDDWSKYLEGEQCRLHLYGKKESRPSRKMGHVTILYT